MQSLARFSVVQLCSAAGALLVVLALAVQTARIEGFKVWPISVKGYKAEVSDLRGQLKAISSKRNEQKETTGRVIERVRVVERDAGTRAERIERAATAPECQTPSEIMGADL
jgi:hypothetical protein